MGIDEMPERIASEKPGQEIVMPVKEIAAQEILELAQRPGETWHQVAEDVYLGEGLIIEETGIGTRKSGRTLLVLHKGERVQISLSSESANDIHIQVGDFTHFYIPAEKLEGIKIRVT